MISSITRRIHGLISSLPQHSEAERFSEAPKTRGMFRDTRRKSACLFFSHFEGVRRYFLNFLVVNVRWTDKYCESKMIVAVMYVRWVWGEVLRVELTGESELRETKGFGTNSGFQFEAYRMGVKQSDGTLGLMESDQYCMKLPISVDRSEDKVLKGSESKGSREEWFADKGSRDKGLGSKAFGNKGA